MNGKLRRRFIRALGWSIATLASFVAVVLLAFTIYVTFFDYPEKLRQSLQTELTELAGAKAIIRSINLNMARYAFELRGIEIASPGGSTEEPLLELERIRGQLRLSEILRLRLHWTELFIEGLSIRLVEDEEDGLRIPGGPGRVTSLAAGGMGFSADRVVFENAALILANETVPWELSASNVHLGVEREWGGHRGKLLYEGGRLTIKHHRDIVGSVEADFEIVSRELLVDEARAWSDFGEARLRGKLGFGGGLRGRFDVSAEGDLARTAESIIGLPVDRQLIEGRAEFRGTLDVEPESKSLEGTLLWPRGRIASVPTSSWNAQIFWDRSLLQVGFAHGQLASGTARLQLHQPLPVADHLASLDLDFENVALGELWRAIGNAAIPIASRVSGRASLAFPADNPSVVDGSFELRGQKPPLTEGGTAERLAFQVRGAVVSGDIEIEEALLDGDTLGGSIAGFYPRSGSVDLDLELLSIDLAQMDRIQQALRSLARGDDEPEPEIWGIGGSGRAQGRLTERLPHLHFEGELKASELSFESVNWGEVHARGSILHERMAFEDLVATKGDAVAAGSGSLALTGNLGHRDFEGDFKLARWPFKDFEGFLEFASPPADGLLSGEVKIRRRGLDLDGVATLRIDDVDVMGHRFDRGEVRLALNGRDARLSPIHLFRGDETLGGELALRFDSGTVSGSLTTNHFPLTGTDFGGLGLEGWIEGHVEIAGGVDAPIATLGGRAGAVTLGGVPLGEAFVSGELRDDLLALDFTLESEASELAMQATANLAGDRGVTGKIRWRELDSGPWLRLAYDGLGENVRMTLSGEASFRMPLSRDAARGIVATGALSQVVVEGESYRLVSTAAVDLRLEQGVLEIDHLELAQDASRLGLSGRIDLANEGYDLQADGVLALEVLGSFYPRLAASGDAGLEARITGSWEQPALTGYADLNGASLRLEGFPQALGGLTGRVVFDNRTLRIPELRAVFGSGPVGISGAVSLAGLRPGSMDLQIAGSEIRLRYPEGFVATLEVDLSLVGSQEQQILSGRVDLDEAVWTREYDLVSGILTDREGLELFGEFEENELLSGLRFDVTIVAPESLRVRNTIANIDASAELELRGSLAEPVLLGSSEAERGEIFLLGQRYNITSGKVDFVDPTKVEPFIDLTAETRVRSYRVELRLTGTVDRFHPELTSDPPLRTVDILRLLAGATEREIQDTLIGTEEEELAGVGVASLLTERLSQELGRRAERLFGLDRFSIDPFLIGQFANPTARVSLGKQITRDLSINYSSNLNATTEAIILIEYTPQGPMSWILSRDEEGDVGIDVKFRRSF